ncbi:unnamed protein product [Trypanosoma congolense IL3000]|uniref:WGS project CAEQ00000000 data, annotated contig 185 n=1 Tax=Trypanosoma congolense (strain IL3000) TaxID=1068625 RepID=F9W9E0_TRYCI|nr:unnamed protein product [Trypanosoma congolense IL3000]
MGLQAVRKHETMRVETLGSHAGYLSYAVRFGFSPTSHVLQHPPLWGQKGIDRLGLGVGRRAKQLRRTIGNLEKLGKVVKGGISVLTTFASEVVFPVPLGPVFRLLWRKTLETASQDLVKPGRISAGYWCTTHGVVSLTSCLLHDHAKGSGGDDKPPGTLLSRCESRKRARHRILWKGAPGVVAFLGVAGPAPGAAMTGVRGGCRKILRDSA